MSKNLVIVESPAKAKTIEKFLGRDYQVVASFGHIRDLPKSGLAIDVEHDFAPTYEISPDKKSRVSELKKLAKSADTVWLASDEDREGEAIAWHLSEALSLKAQATRRIVFHEITESAIKAAIANPREVDRHVVDAQQARRVLDRLVGYELSPVLWKKVQRGLSAGRVQSVAVRMIVEREREIENFKSQATYRVTAEFPLQDGALLAAELPEKLATEDEARRFLTDATGANFTVANLETKPAKRMPAPPFTTSTLQQEASRKLGYSVKQTMVLAQRLYEAGHITYMRTDSVHLSDTAISGAAGAIAKTYGTKYAKTRQFTTKSAGAQEAHEAIRPTNFARSTITAESGEAKLYDLIYKRTVASQMADATLERTKAYISVSSRPEQLVASGEVVIFDGFLKVYLASRDEDETEDTSGILPPLTIGQELNLKIMQAIQSFTRPKPRYTEASLVKALEERGIGRPSTYAPTISTIQDRQYVDKGDLEGSERSVKRITLENGRISDATTSEITGADKGKLVPTDIGLLVNDFLVSYFPVVVDLQFTANVEQQFDDIAAGEKSWQKVIDEFYKPFHQTVVDAEGISRQAASGARELGTDPATGKPIIARLGRFGPMFQLGLAEDDEKPKFAAVMPGRKLADVTLEEALEAFKMPRLVGTTDDGEEILANFGRFGPYIKFGKSYVSIKPDDPHTISLERALELIADKKAADAAKYIKQFDGTDIAIVNGRYGIYITDGKTNAKIPKETEPAKLTLDECKALIAAAPKRTKRKRISKR